MTHPHASKEGHIALNKQAQKVKYSATDVVAEPDDNTQQGGDAGGNTPGGELEG